MRNIKVVVYNYEELSDAAKARARDAYREAGWAEPDHVSDSLRDSWNELRKYIMPWADSSNDVSNLSGPRAMAWVEHNVLAPLRIPIGSYKYNKRRRQLANYGRHYRQGLVMPCPFTGICYDEIFIEKMVQWVHEGHDLNSVYHWLEDEIAMIYEREREYYYSDEAVADVIITNGYEFTEDGELYV